MQLIWNCRAVDEDTALVPEDASLDKNLSLTTARNKLSCKFLKQDHVSIEDWRHETQVHDLAIPLTPLVLSKNGFDKDACMVSAISESKAFQYGWQVRTHATFSDRV